MAEENKVEVPSKFKEIVEQIEKMSVLELSELVKVFENRFGVSAQSMVVAAPAQAGGDAGGGDEGALKTLELKSAGDQKIQVIKVVKDILDLGLKEAKALVDEVPKVIKEGLKPEEAEELKKKFEDAGATVEIK
ncbi:50S ribosomal protein L7/L12 [Patescibacteria group bacterium]|nr:50S ribosomal protein L7/L12 [Patescibacteria group bacterium]